MADPNHVKVLHVDDDAMLLGFVEDFVTQIDPDIHFTNVESPKAAIELLQSREFDCIVSDYKMPELNGIQLAQQIRRLTDSPIILYTGQGSEEVAEQAYSVGINDYLRKENHPAHYQVLAKRIRQAVENRRADIRAKLYEEKLEALYTHILVLERATGFDDVCKATLDAAESVMGFHLLSYLQVQGGNLCSIGNRGSGKLGLSLPLDDKGITVKAARERQSILVNDLRSDPDFVKGNMDSLSELAVPVLVDGETFSVINVESLESNFFTDEDKRLLEIFSSHVSLTIKRLGMLESERRSKGKLEALQLNAIKLSQAWTIDEALDTTCEILGNEFSYDWVGIGRVDEEAIQYIKGIGINLVGDEKIPLDRRSITVRAVKSGETQIVPDTSIDGDYMLVNPGDAKACSELVVPIHVNGRVEFVINLDSIKLNAFTNEDRHLIELLSLHLGSAVRLIRKREKLTSLHLHASHLALSTDIEDIAKQTLVTLREVLDFKISSFHLVKGSVIELIANTGFGVEGGFTQALDGPGLIPYAMRECRSVYVPDVTCDEHYVMSPLSLGDERSSEFVVPIIIDGVSVAAINLEDKRVNGFSDEDRELVELLSEHVVSAISRNEQIRVIKSSGKALVKSEKRLQYILDSAPEGVTVNVLGKVMYVNQHFADMMGYTVDELLGKNSLKLTKENYREMVEDRTRRRALGEDVPSQYEVELIRKDGTFLPVEYSISRIVFNGENASLTFIRDITQRREKRELEKKIDSLHTHAHVLNRLQSIDEIAKETLEILHDHLNCNLLCIRSVIGDYLQPVADWGTKSTGKWMPIQGKCVTARAAREKRSMLVPDMRVDPDFVRGRIDSLSELVVPILCRDEVIGVLNAGSLELGAFDDNDRVLMETLADEVGSAMMRIKSMELVHSYKFKLEALSNYASKLATCIDLSDIVKIIIETVHKVIGADYGSFALIKGDKLSLIKVIDSNESWCPELSLDGPGVTVRAAKTGETQLVPDTRVERDYLGLIESGLVYLSELAVPVAIGGEVKAVINVESMKANAFTGEDKRLIELFAKHVASAISRIEQFGVIRASEASYRKVLDSSLDSVLLLSGTKLVYVNCEMVKLLGYDDASELIGQDVTTTLADDEKEKIRQRTLSRQRGDPQPERYELKLIRKDGSIVEVEAAVSLTEYGGKPAVLSFARDISDRKRYQAKLIQLHESSRKLAVISTRDEVWDVAIETVSQILGFDFAGIGVIEGNTIKYVRSVGAELPKDWSIDISKPSISSRAIETGIPQLVSDTSLDPDYLSAPGLERHSSELAIPIMVDGHPVALLNVENNRPSAFTETDVSLIQILAGQVYSAIDRITHGEEEAKAIETRQRERLEGLERMSGMVRHDLRGPLQTIQSAAYMLRRRPDRVEELTRKIDDGVEYAVRILDDLSIMSRPEVLNKVSTNLSDLVEKSLDGASIPATVRVERSLAPLSLEIDQYRIRRVVDNLVKNAVEAMPGGGSLMLKVEAVDGIALLTVRDSGRGIPDDAARNLFTPFFTTKSTGTGLGLAICKRLVEAHGGRIMFESRVGEGTTFKVALPMSQMPSQKMTNIQRSSSHGDSG